MKILHVNCADRGSTGKIILEISDYAAKEGHESFLCVPKINMQSDCIQKVAVCMPHEQGVYRRIASVLGLQYGFSPLPTHKIIGAIQAVQPDVVHLHSINCSMVNIYRLLAFLKKKKIPTVVTNHAEFFYTGNCSQAAECERWRTGCGNCPDPRGQSGSRIFDRTALAWQKMKQAFGGFERLKVVSVSPWVMHRSLASPIMEGIDQCVVYNGVNTDIFTVTDGSHIREKHGIKADEKMVVCVTSSFHPGRKNDVKGSAFLVDLARKLQGHAIKIVVVGSYYETELVLPDNLILAGAVYDQKELAAYYSAADLTVITSLRETFSMPVAESLCCGTPIVGFQAGGPESISIAAFSQFVEQGNVEGLANAMVSNWIERKAQLGAETISAAAKEKFSSEAMAKQYLSIYKELV